MQYVDLLGAIDQADSAATFANKLFSVLGVENQEARESSNYVDGQYFKGHKGNLSLTVSLSDEEGHEDRPYWIHVAMEASDKESACDIVDRIIREKALPAGFRMARMINFGKRKEQRIDY